MPNRLPVKNCTSNFDAITRKTTETQLAYHPLIWRQALESPPLKKIEENHYSTVAHFFFWEHLFKVQVNHLNSCTSYLICYACTLYKNAKKKQTFRGSMLHVSNNSIASKKRPEENRSKATFSSRSLIMSLCCSLSLEEIWALAANTRASSMRLSASNFSNCVSQEIGSRANKSISVEAKIRPSPFTIDRTLSIAIVCLHC